MLKHRVAFWTAFPFLLPQGLWLRATARRIDPPPGQRSGVVGAGATLPVLVLGDSVVDGVGADSVVDALAGRFGVALADRFDREVAWRAVGENGARVQDLLTTLLARCPDAGMGVVLISVGVNDVTGLTRSGAWRRRLTELLDRLADRYPDAQQLLAGVPPLRYFPAIPQPLRQVLALRADTFDAISAEVCERRSGCRFVPTDFLPDPDDFAADGYHPGPRGYEGWGRHLADQVAAGSVAS